MIEMITDFFFPLIIEEILGGIIRFLKYNRTPKFLRILTVLFLFLLSMGIMALFALPFAEVNTVLAFIVFIIGTLICFHFAMKAINIISNRFKKKE